MAQSDLTYNYLQVTRHQQTWTDVRQYMTFHDHNLVNVPYHLHLNLADQFGQNTERFTTYFLKAQYYLNTRLLLAAEVPWIQKQRLTDGSEVFAQSGIGDIRVNGKYYLFNSDLFEQEATWAHKFLIGAGIQFPTGGYQDVSEETNNEIEPHFQAGSGAFSYQFVADYLLTSSKWNVHMGVQYHLRTANRYSFAYGDQWLGLAKVFYRHSFTDFAISPSIGACFVNSEQDSMNEAPSPEDAAAQVWWGEVGLSVGYRNIWLRAQYQHTLGQKLEGIQPSYKNQWEVGIEFRFKKRELVKNRIR